MDFFNQAKESIYSPKFYRDLLAKPISYSIKYFLSLALVFALLFMVKFSVLYVPPMNDALSGFSQKAGDFFPEELEVNIKGGNLSTNVEEPYYVKAPKELRNGGAKNDLAENLVVIDTKNGASIENFKNYDTMVLLTKDYIIYKKDNSQITSQPLADVPDLTVNRVVAKDFVAKYAPYLKLLVPLAVGLSFMVGFFIVAFKAIYLLFGALAVLLVARAKGIDIQYQKAYQLGLHLVTLPLLVVSLLLPHFFLAFTVSLVAIAAINIEKAEKAVSSDESAIIAEE